MANYSTVEHSKTLGKNADACLVYNPQHSFETRSTTVSEFQSVNLLKRLDDGLDQRCIEIIAVSLFMSALVSIGPYQVRLGYP